MVSLMIVVIDEQLDLLFEITRQEVVFQQYPVPPVYSSGLISLTFFGSLSLPFIHPGGIFKQRGEHLHDAGRQLV
jgi:hypothetical protein